MKKALAIAGTPEKQLNMRVTQIWQWIYEKGIRDFDRMTNLAKAYRALLKNKFTLKIPEVVKKYVSEDGTRKYLVKIEGGSEIETVYIP